MKPKTKTVKRASKPTTRNPIRVGSAVIIRAVTLYYTGRIVEITATDLVLGDAAWVASTGRFSDALRTGVLDEVEPYPGAVAVARGSICDVADWPHALPREQR